MGVHKRCSANISSESDVLIMGTIIASTANDNVCLAPADSQAEATTIITHFTANTMPQETIDLWTGATYRVLDVPVGENYEDYKLDGGAIVKLSTLFTLENLKTEAHTLHDYLNVLASAFEGLESYLWEKDTVDKSHDYIAWLHKGMYAVVGRHATSVAALTLQQRIEFCQLSLLGTSDVNDISTEDVDTRVAKIYGTIAQDTHSAPTSPVVFVDPRDTPTAVALDDVKNLGGTGTYTDVNGDAQTGLGLDTVTTFTALDIGGTWIDNLTE